VFSAFTQHASAGGGVLLRCLAFSAFRQCSHAARESGSASAIGDPGVPARIWRIVIAIIAGVALMGSPMTSLVTHAVVVGICHLLVRNPTCGQALGGLPRSKGRDESNAPTLTPTDWRL